jgi:RNA polymerase sigma-70 factor (ECF subfamily)
MVLAVADDLELARAAVAGDRVALEEIVRDTQDHVWRYCAYLGPRGDADDLVQDTYVRVLRALPSYAGRSALRTWVLSIARRVCADAIRSARRRNALGALWARTPVATSDHSEAIGITLLLEGLDADRREAFVLTQLVGLAYAETAAVVGVPVGTIRSRVARARSDLQLGLGEATG